MDKIRCDPRRYAQLLDGLDSIDWKLSKLRPDEWHDGAIMRGIAREWLEIILYSPLTSGSVPPIIPHFLLEGLEAADAGHSTFLFSTRPEQRGRHGRPDKSVLGIRGLTAGTLDFLVRKHRMPVGEMAKRLCSVLDEIGFDNGKPHLSGPILPDTVCKWRMRAKKDRGRFGDYAREYFEHLLEQEKSVDTALITYQSDSWAILGQKRV